MIAEICLVFADSLRKPVPMKRSAIATVLGLAALGLLILLAAESRPLAVGVHVAQYTVAGDLGRVNQDFRTLVTTLEAARRDVQAPGEGARALLERVAQQPQQLPNELFEMRGNASQAQRLRNSFEGFTATIGNATKLARELLVEQGDYAASVHFLRDSGVRVIEEMRDMNLNRGAADTFQLVVGSLSFAGPASTVQEYELRRLLAALARDQRVDTMPNDFRRLLAAAETILTSKTNIESKLTQLAGTPVVASATNLSLAAQDLYNAAVDRIDQARFLLAVYAVVLLAALGLLALRLHGSYRDLNRANGDLATLNESLEQRVVDRTKELEGTLANLKESQVQLVQAEKMSSLGQLVAGISHEINTPLLYLTNNAELIRERLELVNELVRHCTAAFSIKASDFADRAQYQMRFVNALKDVKVLLRDADLEASVQEAQDLARDSIEGLSELTEMAQSLKDFSRLDRAPVARFDVHAGIDKTLLIAKNIVKHKATVRKFYGDIPEIECSPSQINQVFLNIVTNAAQAIEETGEIVITTKRRGADHVEIRIADTGCGIPEENLARIRDPFFTTKEVGTGTGLGLAIVEEIVHSHGGELLVESQVGKGSAFTVVLPIKHRDAAHAAGTPAAAEDHNAPLAYAEAV